MDMLLGLSTWFDGFATLIIILSALATLKIVIVNGNSDFAPVSPPVHQDIRMTFSILLGASNPVFMTLPAPGA